MSVIKVVASIFVLMVLGLCVLHFFPDFSESMVKIIGKKGIVTIATALIGGLVAYIIAKLKENSSFEIFKNEIKSDIDKLIKSLTETNVKIDHIQYQWNEVTSVKVTQDRYDKQLRNISSTSIMYFKGDYNLKNLGIMISESLIDFSADIHDYELTSETCINMIDQKLLVFINMIRYNSEKQMGRKFTDIYFSQCFLTEVEIFKSKVQYIVDDKDNNKQERLHIIMKAFMKNVLSELLQTWLTYRRDNSI